MTIDEDVVIRKINLIEVNEEMWPSSTLKCMQSAMCKECMWRPVHDELHV